MGAPNARAPQKSIAGVQMKRPLAKSSIARFSLALDDPAATPAPAPAPVPGVGPPSGRGDEAEDIGGGGCDETAAAHLDWQLNTFSNAMVPAARSLPIRGMRCLLESKMLAAATGTHTFLDFAHAGAGTDEDAATPRVAEAGNQGRMATVPAGSAALRPGRGQERCAAAGRRASAWGALAPAAVMSRPPPASEELDRTLSKVRS
mmetsp:Transcript_32051/g.81351  ORF Transcript_32051/g.81351 Transcript_32051/m.81351 type:complete len:204 (-) Transcript_32051:30-641(-)